MNLNHFLCHLAKTALLFVICCASITVHADNRLSKSPSGGNSSELINAANRVNADKQVGQDSTQKQLAFKGAHKLSTQLQQSITLSATDESLSQLPFIRVRSNNEVQIAIELIDTDASTIAVLREGGLQIEVISKRLKKVQAWATRAQLTQLSGQPFVKRITAPNYAHVRAGSVQTEGDIILKSDLVRAMGLSGKGIKVGIISDGANDAASAQATDNLPANITTFGSCSTRAENIANCIRESRCNEGTAMAEIIHDIAPEAELAIAAVSSDIEFVQRLDQLANDFGADIIVDDLGFFGEPFFEDGPLAEAVSALPENILYVSSAGNSGNTHYEANYRRGTIQGTLAQHEFATNDDFMGFLVPSRGFVVPILQWNTPFDNPQSDYDLFVDNGGEILRSVADQNTAGVPPFEAVCVPNPSGDQTVGFMLINRFAGGSNRLEVFMLGSSAIEYPIPEGSVFGHPGVPRALAIGTINSGEEGNDEIAFYSSQGPSRIDFPSRQDRQKPDLTGIDGVSVTGAGGFFSPFFGTSAAAPHVAGVAALLMSGSPNISADDVRRALEESAIDLGASGRDAVYGEGLVDALEAKSLLRIGVPLPPFIILLDDED